MNRYLLLATAAASVAVTGPLPDLQWQNNLNRLVDFVAQSPSTLTQDARGLNFPVLDSSWMIAGLPDVVNNDHQDYIDSEKPSSDSRSHPPSPGPPSTLSGPPTDAWILKSFECKAQASVCCSKENRLGPLFIQTRSSTKSCAAKSDELWYAGSDLLESGDHRINNYCYKPDYVKGCDTLLTKMTNEPGLVCYSDCKFAPRAQVLNTEWVSRLGKRSDGNNILESNPSAAKQDAHKLDAANLRGYVSVPEAGSNWESL